MILHQFLILLHYFYPSNYSIWYNIIAKLCRFIVVCLLLKKMKLVRDLVRELSKQIGPSQVFFKPISYKRSVPNANERLPPLGLRVFFSPRRIHDHLRAWGPAGVESCVGGDPSFCGGGHRGQRPRQRQQLHRPLAQAFTPRHTHPREKPNHESFSARGALIDLAACCWLDEPVMN